MIRQRGDKFARWRCAVLCGGAALCGDIALASAGGAPVLPWPRTPETASTEVEAGMRAAGHTVADFGPVRARLLHEARLAQASTRRVLADLDAALGAARAAYLEQRYDAMIAGLAGLEVAAATLAADDLCGATLWELEFQIGLAYRARAGAGDEARARARFALAFAIDPRGRPEGALYGPDVSFAFLQAIDEIGGRPARPLAVEVTPGDATVRVDCRPVEQRVGVRPGLHVVTVDAPGHAPEVRLVDTGRDAGVRVELRATADDLGPAWVSGALDPASASARAGMRAIVGPGPIVWFGTLGDRHVARLVVDDALRRTAVGDSDAAAVASVLPDLSSGPGRPPTPARSTRRTRVWLGIGGAVLGSLALGLGLGLGLREPAEGRLQLVAP